MPAQLGAERSGLCHIGVFSHVAHIYMTVNCPHGQFVSLASNPLERADHPCRRADGEHARRQIAGDH